MEKSGGIMKFLLISVSTVFAIMLGASIASAACSGNDVMFSLTSARNAHVAVGDNSLYPYKVCYNDLFGSSYTGSSPRSCIGTNKLMGVFSGSNSHAEGPLGTFFSINICYGNVTCSLKSSCDASKNEVFVVGLSSLTNAHVSTQQSDFANKLCCVASGGQTVEPAQANPWVEHGQIYYVDVPINFTAYRISGSDPATAEWNIDDPSFTSVNSKSFLHAYGSPGQKTITLKTTNSGGSVSEKELSILVLNGPGIFTFIENPSYKQSITSSDLRVYYSGKESYVVDSSSSGSPCTTTVTCLSGNCPLKTKQSPSCSSNKSVQLNVAGVPISHEMIFFNWTFMNDRSSAKGFGAREGNIVLSPGTKSIFLSINYTNSTRGITLNGNFRRDFTLTQSGGPADITDRCSDYTDSSSCNDDVLDVVTLDPLWNTTGNCNTISGEINTTCKCAWESSCIFKVSRYNMSSGEVTPISQCTKTISSVGQCVDGMQEVTVIATVVGNDPSCLNSTETVPCGISLAELPFFTEIQAIAVISLIVAAYAIIVFTKKTFPAIFLNKDFLSER